MQPSPRRTRVMLVDDHTVARAGCRFMLDNLGDLEIVAEASSGEEALQIVPKVQPDVVILDLTMPGMGGRATLEQLRTQWPDCKVLICTMHETPALIDQALKAGASGYISKNSSPEVLVTAVRKIAQGQRYVDAELAQSFLTNGSKPALVGLSALSPRELQILCLYSEACGLEDIAARLSISAKTVANNLTIIKDKLQVDSTAELVRLAIAQGLVTVPSAGFSPI